MNKAENCTAFLGGRQCKILSVETCAGCDCAFYHTEKQVWLAKEKVDKRLRSLPKEIQMYIADKYYSGKMPWQKGVAAHGC